MAMEVQDAEQSARRAAARGLRVRIPMKPSEWAGKYRRLSSKVSAEPGRWRSERMPFLNAIMDALDDRHLCHSVVCKKCAQIGLSECALNWIGWTIHESPSSIMIFLPTDDMGERWTRSRLHTMIRECPELLRILPFGRKADAGNSVREKHYPGGILYIGSANNANHLAGQPVPRLVLDEVARMPRTLKGEGNPVALAKMRATTFKGRSKMFLISTPTDESSLIDQEYALSSRGKYEVPCPHCEHMQALEWTNLKYSEADPRDARMACTGCGVLIDERFKTQMLAGGAWKHEFPERCDSTIGFSLNCLYVAQGLGKSWAENAADFEAAKKDPAKLQVFTNTQLGEMYLGTKVRVEHEDLQQRAEPYLIRTIPLGVLMLTCGIDVQHNRVECQIIGWSRGEKATVIDYHIIDGGPSSDETWKAVDAYLSQKITNEYGVEMELRCTFIDAGSWQHEITNFTRDKGARNIFASKGSSVISRPAIGRPTLVDINYRGMAQRRGAALYIIGPSVLKTTLYTRLLGDKEALPDDRMVRFPNKGLPAAYFEQLTAEVKDPDRGGGWFNIRERNEALDTFILAMAAALHQSTQVHRMREADWQRLEQLYEPAEGSKPVPVAPTLSGGRFMPTPAVIAPASEELP